MWGNQTKFKSSNEVQVFWEDNQASRGTAGVQVSSGKLQECHMGGLPPLGTGAQLSESQTQNHEERRVNNTQNCRLS